MLDTERAISDLCRLLHKADALAHAAEHLFEGGAVINSVDAQLRERLAHLIGATAESVQAAAAAARKLNIDRVGRDHGERERRVGVGEWPSFLGRLVGWTHTRAVEQSLKVIELAVAHRIPVILSGSEDLIPIAHALHCRMFGRMRPFVVCDPRRRNTPASLRSPPNVVDGVAAFNAARTGSLCVRGSHLPGEFPLLASLLRNVDDTLLMMCLGTHGARSPLLVKPGTIWIPPVAQRGDELSRIVDEYAYDASVTLGLRKACFSNEDRDWMFKYSSSSLSSIEQGTLRLMARNISNSMGEAADRLGITPGSLNRWFGRRPPPPIMAEGPTRSQPFSVRQGDSR